MMKAFAKVQVEKIVLVWIFQFDLETSNELVLKFILKDKVNSSLDDDLIANLKLLSKRNALRSLEFSEVRNLPLKFFWHFKILSRNF